MILFLKQNHVAPTFSRRACHACRACHAFAAANSPSVGDAGAGPDSSRALHRPSSAASTGRCIDTARYSVALRHGA
jgi:hypothetical protein